MSFFFKNGNQARGFAVTLVIGIGFIMMAMAFLDTESSELISQLIAVVVLLVFLIGAAALMAWLIRKLIQKINK